MPKKTQTIEKANRPVRKPKTQEGPTKITQALELWATMRQADIRFETGQIGLPTRIKVRFDCEPEFKKLMDELAGVDK
jgi:hypothetical protein